MTERVLDEAMRYGSRRTYGEQRLGKFGLGLKTASLSQCRRLTVATRTTPRRADPRSAAGTSTTCARATPGSSSGSSRRSARRTSSNRSASAPGTVVLWEKLDRILAYCATRRRARAEGARGDERVDRRAPRDGLPPVPRRRDVATGRRLAIIFNGEPLEPWDPFARVGAGDADARRAAARRRARRRRRTSVVSGRTSFRARSSSRAPEAHAGAAGPKKWNRQQGFYIYRGDRMIQSGGWNRLRTMDEHSKLARIALDVPAALEDLFQINVAKMRVALPDELRPQLGALAAGVVTVAQEAYRHRLRLVADPVRRSDGSQYASFAEDGGGRSVGSGR